MWLILKGGNLNKFNINSRIFPLKKLNILIGANDSGKSYFMRELMSSIIAIKTTEELINELTDRFKKLDSLTNFPFEIFKDLDYESGKKLVDYNEQFKLDFIETRRRDVVDISRGKYNYYKIINLEDAKNHYEYIKNVTDDISQQSVFEWDYNDAEYLLSEIHPKFIKLVVEWLRTDFIKFVVNNKDVLPKLDKMFDINKNFFEEIRVNYTNTMKMKQIGSEENSEFDDARIKLFIPVSRTTRHPGKLATSSEQKAEAYEEDIYKNRVSSEYNIKEDYIDVFTGVDLYQRYKTALLGDQKEREKIKILENFLSNHFFSNKKISIIPDERTYELKIHIDGDDDKHIYKVGDGISSLIILFFALKIENKNLVFIEEPEQNLHAGFQRLVSLLLGDKSLFKEKYIFITTHSNHIIDASIATESDRNLYSVRKTNNKFKIQNETEGSTLFLEELGVLPSSVFLANKVIWVEGKYDALYIRSLLEMKYREKDEYDIYKNKRFVEGVDYVFVPYAGSNRTLIDFKKHENIFYEDNYTEKILSAIKLSKDYIFVMDDDGLNEGRDGVKMDFYKKIRDDIGTDKVHKLQAFEIENIAPKEVVINYAKSQIIMNEETIEHYTKKYTKLDVEKVLEKTIDEKDYKNKKMYKYLNGILVKNFGKSNLSKITRSKEGFKSQYSLKNKEQYYEEFRIFCNESDKSKRTKSAQSLLDFVYEFISS